MRFRLLLPLSLLALAACTVGPDYERPQTAMAGDWLEAGRTVSAELGLPLSLKQLPNAHPADGIHMGLRGAAARA